MTSRLRGPIATGLTLGEFALSIAALGIASDWRSPLLADYRVPSLATLVAVPLILVGTGIWLLRRPQRRALRIIRVATIILAAAALACTAFLEGRFWWERARLFAAEPERVARLGRHFIVGYRDPAAIDALLERRAIAGVFVSARNFTGQTADTVGRQIAAWQNLRRSQGLPPLLVTTDQEGGVVSRLSPPLPRQPPLATTAAQRDRNNAAYAYGLSQGRALASLGINLNFAPVVDLDFGLLNANDRYTRIHQRAISDDPAIVIEVARHYCRGLAAATVHCTLKHFPGIGRVFSDTHIGPAELQATIAELEQRDWIPFRALMPSAGYMMVGHARLAALDPERPASLSNVVINGLLRRNWGYDGILITDDFAMRAVYGRPSGLFGAGVEALNAGIDLILVSYDPDLYFDIMNGLLRADRDGRLSDQKLQASVRRLDAAAAAIRVPGPITP